MTNKQTYVGLSAGHSSTDCGAVAADGTTEAELVTQFRNIVAECPALRLTYVCLFVISFPLN
jgi:N-acetylmuramoyl-L-alanine amidase